MKLPGIYAAYAAIFAVFGETPAAIHTGLLLVNAATAICLFFLVSRLFGNMAAFVAGASYVLLSTSSSVMGFEAHATNFVVLPALLGILFLLRAMESGRLWHFFASGVLLGIAVLMKQHGVFFVLFCLLYLGLVRWKERQRLQFVREGLLFGSGVALPYVAACVLLLRAGVFRAFWFWTVDYAGEYSKMGLRRAVRAFLENSRTVVSPAVLVWILAAAGIIALFWSSSARRHSHFLWLLLVCSFLALCPGAYFRVHYYILLLPVVAILAGVAVSSATEKFADLGTPRIIEFVPVLVFLACFGFAVWSERNVYFSMDADAAMRSTYGDNAFLPAMKIADYLKENSPPGASIAVLGSEPEIYFYARRHSAISYIYMYSLIVRHRYTARMRAEMMQELEANRPQYVVYVDSFDSWGDRAGQQPAEFLSGLHDYMNREYGVVGIAEIGERPEYFWGSAAESYLPESPNAIYVLKRRADLPE
jgi:hypothetical protein